MEVTYRRNLHKSYMCIQEQREVEEEYELQMLAGVRVPYLLNMEIITVEGEKQYLYDISGKQQLEDYLSGKKMDYKMLWKVLYAIRELCLVLPDYLLRESGIYLDTEYIYVNLEDEGLYFVYFPFWNQNLPEAFEHYMEQTLRKIDHQDLAATELGYQVYQRCMRKNTDIQGILEHVIKRRMCNESEIKIRKELDVKPEEFNHESIQEKSGEESFGEARKMKKSYLDLNKFFMENVPWLSQFLSDMKEKNSKGKNEKEKVLKEKVREKKVSGKKRLSEIFQKEITMKEKFLKKKKAEIQREKRQGREDDEKEDRKETNFAAWEEKEFIAEKEPIHPTEILGVCSQGPIGKLMYQGMHGCEDIWMEGEECLLGKNRQQARGIIEAEGISRLHARISKEDGEYYLEDLNSTNGTYLNGEPVEYHQKKKLCKGDCIRFGAEEFLFC